MHINAEKVAKKTAYLGASLGLIAIVLFLAGVICFRFEILEFGNAFALVKLAIPTSLAASVVSILVTLWILFRPVKTGLRVGVAGVLLGLALTLPMLRMKSIVDRVPRIHDITTDTEKPPQYRAILPLRKNAMNSTEYEGATLAEEQHKAYPDIQPLVLSAPPAEAFQMLIQKVRLQPWEVVDVDRDAMKIEATATSALFNFKDDVVIQVTPVGEGSRIDMRSISRVGKSDFGKNAERIRVFFSSLQPKSNNG